MPPFLWQPRGPFPHKIVPALFVGYVNNGRLLGLVSLSADIEDEKLEDVPAQVTFVQTNQWTWRLLEAQLGT